jgi:hypothetical protein
MTARDPTTGRVYYYHAGTRQTSWKPPPAAEHPPPPPPPPPSTPATVSTAQDPAGAAGEAGPEAASAGPSGSAVPLPSALPSEGGAGPSARSPLPRGGSGGGPSSSSMMSSQPSVATSRVLEGHQTAGAAATTTPADSGVRLHLHGSSQEEARDRAALASMSAELGPPASTPNPAAWAGDGDDVGGAPPGDLIEAPWLANGGHGASIGGHGASITHHRGAPAALVTAAPAAPGDSIAARSRAMRAHRSEGGFAALLARGDALLAADQPEVGDATLANDMAGIRAWATAHVRLLP